MTSKTKHPTTNVQGDDTPREKQASHGTQQNRSKKEGHATQLGSGLDQQSRRGPPPGNSQRKP